MLKNAINVTGLNRQGRLAGAFRRPDNDCVSRVPFPAQEAVRTGFADWLAASLTFIVTALPRPAGRIT